LSFICWADQWKSAKPLEEKIYFLFWSSWLKWFQQHNWRYWDAWIVNTRWLKLALSFKKHKAWVQIRIDELISKEQVTAKEIEQLLGRLNHAGFIIPMARHFLGRLQEVQYAAEQY
jgi:hypothetical protein